MLELLGIYAIKLSYLLFVTSHSQDKLLVKTECFYLVDSLDGDVKSHHKI